MTNPIGNVNNFSEIEREFRSLGVEGDWVASGYLIEGDLQGVYVRDAPESPQRLIGYVSGDQRERLTQLARLIWGSADAAEQELAKALQACAERPIAHFSLHHTGDPNSCLSCGPVLRARATLENTGHNWNNLLQEEYNSRLRQVFTQLGSTHPITDLMRQVANDKSFLICDSSVVTVPPEDERGIPELVSTLEWRDKLRDLFLRADDVSVEEFESSVDQIACNLFLQNIEPDTATAEDFRREIEKIRTEYRPAAAEELPLRPFDDGDWSGWAGAEKPDGFEPHIGEIRVAGIPPKNHRDQGRPITVYYNPEATLIVDAAGITINFSDVQEEGWAFALRKEIRDFSLALEVARALRPTMKFNVLIALGFEE
jgi:hypothetical protein